LKCVSSDGYIVKGKDGIMKLKNNSSILYQTAEEIRKHVLKPKSFGAVRVQNIDKL